jgi:hypothetical protein
MEPSDIHQQLAQLRRLLERKFGDFQSLYSQPFHCGRILAV